MQRINRKETMTSTSQRPILQVDALRKTYRKLVAVRDIGFAVYPQQVFCLVGPQWRGQNICHRLYCRLEKARWRGRTLIWRTRLQLATAQRYTHMFLGPKAGNALKKAVQLAPDNPRVVLSVAMSDFNTPEMWGGSKERALAGFQRAAELFSLEKPTNPIRPTWGHSETYAWLGLAYLERDDQDFEGEKFYRIPPQTP